MASLEKLPNEVLCNILGMLTTKEKFRAREVCSRWKDVVDELVPFYGVQLRDQNYDKLAVRFGTRRVSSLEFTYDDGYYIHSTIPIQNLSFLKRLVLTSSMRLDALADAVRRADNLIELEIRCYPSRNWDNQNQIAALLPALRKIKKLILPIIIHHWIERNHNHIWPFNLWKHTMEREMPELQHLEIDVCPANSTSATFFELATLKPHLREFVVKSAANPAGRLLFKKVTVVWNVNGPSRDSEGLRKLKFIHEASCVLMDETPQWKTLLSNQNIMEELQLYDFYVPRPGRGYNMSLIEPVLRRCMETLHTIRLDIGAERVGTSDDFDMEIFAQLTTLRVLHLGVRVVKFQQAIYGNGINFLRGIKNCSTVISATLCKLVLHGFMFSTEEGDDCIKKIAKLDLEKVDFFRSGMPEISKVWKWFSRRARKMGLKKEVRAKTLSLSAEFIGVEFYFGHTERSTC